MPESDWLDEPPRLSTWRRHPLSLTVIGGVIFVAFGSVALAIVPTALLTCERTASEVPGCEVEWRVLFDLVPVRHVTVRELRAVAADALSGTRTDQMNHQLTLQTEAGERRLNLLGELASIEVARDEIADFLANENVPDLHVTIVPTGPFLWVRRAGTGFALFGFFVWATVPMRLGTTLLRGT